LLFFKAFHALFYFNADVRNFKKTGGFGCPDRMMSVHEVFLRQEFTDAISFQQQFSK